MVEYGFEPWERLLLRDYLIMHPEVEKEYQSLKIQLAREFKDNRVKYTNRKGDFGRMVMGVLQKSHEVTRFQELKLIYLMKVKRNVLAVGVTCRPC